SVTSKSAPSAFVTAGRIAFRIASGRALAGTVNVTVLLIVVPFLMYVTLTVNVRASAPDLSFGPGTGPLGPGMRIANAGSTIVSDSGLVATAFPWLSVTVTTMPA